MNVKTFFALGSLFFMGSFLSGGEKAFFMDEEKIRVTLGETPYPYGAKADIRETKFPGERYYHTMTSDIAGTGKAVTKRSIAWFNTNKRIFLHHTAIANISEEIVSSKEDLNKGIIKSRFKVLNFSEKIASAKTAVTIGPVKSEDFVTFLKEIGKEYEPILKTGKPLIFAGLKALAATFVAPAASSVTIPTAISTLSAGLALHVADWFLNRKLHAFTDKDGYFKIDDETVKKQFPDYNAIAGRIRKIQGATIEVTWIHGDGYTNMELINNPGKFSDEDWELITKMIWRMNPLGARTIFPKGSDTKPRWTINAADVGGTILAAGINYDRLDGEIHVINRGKTKKTYEDERILGRRKIPVIRLAIDENYRMRNKIHFLKKWKDNSTWRVGFLPSGTLELALNDDSPDKLPIYVKYLTISGKFDAKVEKDPKSLLATVEFDESNLQMNCTYSQLREGPDK